MFKLYFDFSNRNSSALDKVLFVRACVRGTVFEILSLQNSPNNKYQTIHFIFDTDTK